MASSCSYNVNSLFIHKKSLSTLRDYLKLYGYFNKTHERYAEAEVSEIVDLNKYTLQRNYLKARSLVKKRFDKPFVFLHCLN
jgi:hypothetical protein